MNKSQEISKRLRMVIDGIIITSLFDEYALENVVMGYDKPNEFIDFDEYYSTLKLMRYSPQKVRNNICRSIVQQDLRIVDRDIDDLFLEFYSQKMHYIFMNKMKSEYFDKHDYLQFDDDMRNYLMEVFYLFKQIALTPAEHLGFDFTSLYFSKTDRECNYFNKLRDFIFAIYRKRLPVGKSVERYLKKLPFLPYAVQSLVKKVNKHRVLAVNDPQSLEYKLALLSLIKFHDKRNYRIFELKMEKWRKNLNI